MNHTCLCLPSRSWYSFTDPRGMEGWAGRGILTDQIIGLPVDFQEIFWPQSSRICSVFKSVNTSLLVLGTGTCTCTCMQSTGICNTATVAKKKISKLPASPWSHGLQYAVIWVWAAVIPGPGGSEVKIGGGRSVEWQCRGENLTYVLDSSTESLAYCTHCGSTVDLHAVRFWVTDVTVLE